MTQTSSLFNYFITTWLSSSIAHDHQNSCSIEPVFVHLHICKCMVESRTAQLFMQISSSSVGLAEILYAELLEIHMRERELWQNSELVTIREGVIGFCSKNNEFHQFQSLPTIYYLSSILYWIRYRKYMVIHMIFPPQIWQKCQL